MLLGRLYFLSALDLGLFPASGVSPFGVVGFRMMRRLVLFSTTGNGHLIIR